MSDQLGKQCGKHISPADHQNIAETMHKNRVQNAFASLVSNSLDCSKDERINGLSHKSVLRYLAPSRVGIPYLNIHRKPTKIAGFQIKCGGESGIRTLDTLAGIHDFQSCALGRTRRTLRIEIFRLYSMMQLPKNSTGSRL